LSCRDRSFRSTRSREPAKEGRALPGDRLKPAFPKRRKSSRPRRDRGCGRGRHRLERSEISPLLGLRAPGDEAERAGIVTPAKPARRGPPQRGDAVRDEERGETDEEALPRRGRRGGARQALTSGRMSPAWTRPRPFRPRRRPSPRPTARRRSSRRGRARRWPRTENAVVATAARRRNGPLREKARTRPERGTALRVAGGPPAGRVSGSATSPEQGGGRDAAAKRPGHASPMRTARPPRAGRKMARPKAMPMSHPARTPRERVTSAMIAHAAAMLPPKARPAGTKRPGSVWAKAKRR
jgi:hypothetical protein